MLDAGVPDEPVKVTMNLLTARPFAVVAREPRVIPQVMEQFEIPQSAPDVRPDQQ